MAKNTRKPTNSQTPTTEVVTGQWAPWVRAIVSLLLLFHLAAVIIAPFSMMMPTANLVEPVRRKFQPYHQLTYLGHGYQFFAPDPGPSHFVQYDGIDVEGNRVSGHFPDREAHWPRLHYHRWFMYSERIFELNRQRLSDKDFAEMIGNMNREIQSANQRGEFQVAEQLQREQTASRETHMLVKQQSELLNSALKAEIERKYGLHDVKLVSVERILPAPFEISEDKRKLDDEIYLPEDRKIKLRIVADTDNNAEEIK